MPLKLPSFDWGFDPPVFQVGTRFMLLGRDHFYRGKLFRIKWIIEGVVGALDEREDPSVHGIPICYGWHLRGLEWYLEKDQLFIYDENTWW